MNPSVMTDLITMTDPNVMTDLSAMTDQNVMTDLSVMTDQNVMTDLSAMTDQNVMTDLSEMTDLSKTVTMNIWIRAIITQKTRMKMTTGTTIMNGNAGAGGADLIKCVLDIIT